MAVVAAASILLGGSSLLGSGSSSGIYSSSSVGGGLVGKPFANMIKETSHEDVLSVNTTYEVFIVKRAQLHRLLLVRMKDSSYPWITFEVNTPNMTNLTTVMQETENLPWNSEKVGDFEGNLLGICVIADSVVERMEKYRLFTNNCQHFCNNLLQEMGLETYDTTVGPRTTLEPEFDSHYAAREFDRAYSNAIVFAPSIVARATAAAIGFAIGAPATLVAARNREHHAHSTWQTRDSQ